ncbi:MAG: CPXCG motif-containing cysteine-rich protein [Rudaea sp.]|uniref:CPXCG motif-containing cysteine-rich protein n=1 Tax=unclassified Rudaea TaxID=2627037 RepID=UPI0010F6D76B|nr:MULTISPECIES: CPXCG motif-containing cysteine-rich protein [unclassified Rudaea]MBN8887180.1 CPXCG motif-containing cysteine-rich protein [Rudaea sp.]MBR0346288.1 CPXCG motif-containing cysteine-rich protein [Rudaea sp.]
MNTLEFVTIHCPYCGEGFETQVDLSAGSQSYVEDCAICCKPIEIALRVSDDGELLGVSTRTDRD